MGNGDCGTNTTKPLTTPEQPQKATEAEGEPTGEPEPESVPIPTRSKSPQAVALDDMAATTTQILLENPDMAQRMLEQLRAQP